MRWDIARLGLLFLARPLHTLNNIFRNAEIHETQSNNGEGPRKQINENCSTTKITYLINLYVYGICINISQVCAHNTSCETCTVYQLANKADKELYKCFIITYPLYITHSNYVLCIPLIASSISSELQRWLGAGVSLLAGYKNNNSEKQLNVQYCYPIKCINIYKMGSKRMHAHMHTHTNSSDSRTPKHQTPATVLQIYSIVFLPYRVESRVNLRLVECIKFNAGCSLKSGRAVQHCSTYCSSKFIWDGRRKND